VTGGDHPFRDGRADAAAADNQDKHEGRCGSGTDAMTGKG
jgi:hypothetical protein